MKAETPWPEGVVVGSAGGVNVVGGLACMKLVVSPAWFASTCAAVVLVSSSGVAPMLEACEGGGG